MKGKGFLLSRRGFFAATIGAFAFFAPKMVPDDEACGWCGWNHKDLLPHAVTDTDQADPAEGLWLAS